MLIHFIRSYPTFLPCITSLTSQLQLKGILKQMCESSSFLQSEILSIRVELLSRKVAVFCFSGSLSQSDVSKVAPATNNCNIFIYRFTQIIKNLLGSNTTLHTWKLTLHGDWIIHMDYFDRVEQTLRYSHYSKCMMIIYQEKEQGLINTHLKCTKISQEMTEEWWFERNMTRCVTYTSACW